MVISSFLYNSELKHYRYTWHMLQWNALSRRAPAPQNFAVAAGQPYN